MTLVNMGRAICMTSIALLLTCAEVSAFALGRNAPCLMRTWKTLVAATSEESSKGGDGVAVEEDEYDFDAGFRDRLAKEGGVKGLQMKAAKRSVDTASRAAQRQITTSAREATSSAKRSVDTASRAAQRQIT